jgi:ABC-type phosphate transport system substrate-binding protein
MRKTLAILAWAAIPAALISISACNGNSGGTSGVAPLPNAPAASQHGRVHHNDNSASDLHGGGSTFVAYAYNEGDQPTGLYTVPQATAPPGSLLYGMEQTFGNTDNVYYCETGSGLGRHEFVGSSMVGADACAALGETPVGMGGRGDPVQFDDSDVALSSTECCASGSPYYTNYESTWGQPFEFPALGGAIVYPYINNGSSGLTGLGSNTLQLSTWTYCAITNGTIGYWDDPAITADNGGTAVATHQPITFYYRSDGSGTTYIFEYKLNSGGKGCNQTFKGKYKKAPYGGNGRSAAWTYGIPTTAGNWTGPTGSQASGSTFTGESGNPGVIEGIQGIIGTAYPYATGYAEGAWAAAASDPSVTQACLQSGTVFACPTNKQSIVNALSKATTVTYGGGADGIPLGSSTPHCQLYINPTTFVNPPSGDYPIVGLTYLLFYGKNNGSHLSDEKAMVNFVGTSSYKSILSPLEYTPIPTSLVKKIRKALNGTHKAAPCLNS